MTEQTRHQELGHNSARRGARLLAAVLASALLAACGGGGDDAPAVNAAASPSETAAGATSPPAANPTASTTPPPAPSAPDTGTSPPDTGTSPPDTGTSPPATDGPAVASAKGSVTLSWMPPTTYEDGTPLTITGYRIYWGSTDDYFPHSVTLNNPGLTRYVVDQLPADTYYFVATALSDGNESPFSNVFAMQVL